MLNYNLPHSSRYFPITVRDAYKLIEDPRKVTAEKLHQGDIMDCCLRIISTLLTIGDDILDGHKTRYGKPSWSSLAPSPELAINDTWVGGFIHAKIAAAHLSGTSVYPRALEMINEFAMETLIGQFLDLTTSGITNLDNCTNMEYVKLGGEYKMAPAVVTNAIALALLLTGVEPTDEAVARHIGAEIGYLYEVQNDFLDCYGRDEYGKIGTDVEDGKATWLIAKALELADEHQQTILKQNYGNKDPAAARRVKKVYDQLNLRGAYIEFAKQFHNDFDTAISQLPKIGKVYKYVLDKITNTSCH